RGSRLVRQPLDSFRDRGGGARADRAGLVGNAPCREPIVDFRLFRNVPLSVGCGLGVVIGFALFGSRFLLPQFTQALLRCPAYQRGLVLMPGAVTMLLAMRIVGRVYNLMSPAQSSLRGCCCWHTPTGGADISRCTSGSEVFSILVMSGIGMDAAMVKL